MLLVLHLYVVVGILLQPFSWCSGIPFLSSQSLDSFRVNVIYELFRKSRGSNIKLSQGGLPKARFTAVAFDIAPSYVRSDKALQFWSSEHQLIKWVQMLHGMLDVREISTVWNILLTWSLIFSGSHYQEEGTWLCLSLCSWDKQCLWSQWLWLNFYEFLIGRVKSLKHCWMASALHVQFVKVGKTPFKASWKFCLRYCLLRSGKQLHLGKARTDPREDPPPGPQ